MHEFHDESNGFEHIVCENCKHADNVAVRQQVESAQFTPQRLQRVFVVNLRRYDCALKSCFKNSSTISRFTRSLCEGGQV